MGDRRGWSQEELLFLLCNIDESEKILAVKLSRTVSSVHSMRRRLSKLYSFCNEDCENCPFCDCLRPADSF